MTILIVVVALLSLAVFSGLVAIRNRRVGGMVGQAGIVVAAIVLFAANVADPEAQRVFVSTAGLLVAGVGLMSAAMGGMGYHLFLGRFTDLWAARAVFLAVSLGVAAALGAALMYLV